MMRGRNMSHPGDNPLNNFCLNFFCRNGEMINAKKAIEKGADVNKVVLGYMSPLREAIYSGKYKIVELLCENGAVITGAFYEKSPLTTAEEVLEIAEKHGIDGNITERQKIVAYIKTRLELAKGNSK